LQEEDSAACLDEQVEQTDLCEKVIDNISDEDEIPQASTIAESTNLPIASSLILPSLVADYESEDSGKKTNI